MDRISTSSVPSFEDEYLPPAAHTQPPRGNTISQYLKNIWRRCYLEAGTYSKPGPKRELASWAGIMVFGTGTVISFLYLLVFVWQPHSTYSVAAHNFISDHPMSGELDDGLARWEQDFSKSVIPIMVHSHNDYWRPYPLFSALAAGCTGVEADVWLTDDGTDLLVGHDRASLHPSRTLRSLYLDPLLEILERQNPDADWANHTVYDRARGVFSTQPNTTLTLLIDVKTDAQKTWEVVVAQLEPLRKKQFLTRYEVVYTSPGFREKQDMWPGPVIVVATGNMNRDAYREFVLSGPIVESPDGNFYSTFFEYHDFFYDAPLELLPKNNRFWSGPDPNGGRWTSASTWYNPDEAYYASTSFNKVIGSVRAGFSEKQLAAVREQIRIAKKSGLVSRFWDVPSWPINYRDYVWDVLTREGVGMLSVDDLESAAKRGWSQGYIRSVVWMSLASAWLFCSAVITIWLVYRMIKKRTELIARQENAIFLE